MQQNKINEAGYSIIELLLVLAITAILSAITIMSFGAVRMNKTDAQAVNLVDIFQEARQRAISQRTTMRVELNRTDQVIRLIDEGRNTLAAKDDVQIKSSAFLNDGVIVGLPPSNQTSTPTESTPIPQIAFAPSVHPSSLGKNVATLRFLRNGTVTNTGNDAIGTGATTSGATIYVWSKFEKDNSQNPTTAQIFRAVTVTGSTGLSRVWKCGSVNNVCKNWNK